MSTSVAGGTTPPAKIRARSAWGAALLSFLTPGLGHLYVGRPRRALVLFVLSLAFWAMIVWWRTGALPRFWMTAVLIGAWLALLVFTVIDAVLIARGAKGFALRPYNKWYVYVGAWVAGWVVTMIPFMYLQSHARSGYYSTPSGSMQPTLRIGENFLADTAYYDSHEPRRGDVAIYALPKDPQTTYVKRIIAVAGDRISVKNGHAVVNGTPVDEIYIDVGDSKAFYNNTIEFTVPAGHIFVLGDNRANSLDSRVATHGMIPVANLRGRVTDIVFSRDLARIGQWVGTPQ